MDPLLTRLVVYGSLAPGGQHHDLLAPLGGIWTQVEILGRIDRSGEYPVFTPDAAGEMHAAWLLESDALPGAWPRLDEFEGGAYRRTTVHVDGEYGAIEACIYVAAAI